MKTNFRVVIPVSIAFACCIILPACHSTSGKEVNPSSDAPSTVTMVMVSKIDTENLQSSFAISGVAKANQEVKVYAMSNGYVKGWKHDIGDTVRKGEVLAILDNPELMQQEAKAEAQFNGDKAI